MSLNTRIMVALRPVPIYPKGRVQRHVGKIITQPGRIRSRNGFQIRPISKLQHAFEVPQELAFVPCVTRAKSVDVESSPGSTATNRDWPRIIQVEIIQVDRLAFLRPVSGPCPCQMLAVVRRVEMDGINDYWLDPE